MKEIKLTQGKVAFVDDEDFDFLNQWKWFAANPKNDIWYAKRTDNKNKKSIRMHRVIMKITDTNDLIDHKDRNGLNNQKSNLRKATRSQNAANSKSTSKTSKYKGVSFHKTWKRNILKSGEEKLSIQWRWHAQIRINNKQKTLGKYKTEKEAALAYNEAAIKVYGEFANLNIIDD